MRNRPNRPPLTSAEISSFSVALASVEQILSWSHGEVSNPAGFNLITGKPEIDSLFCPRTFGPVKDNECLCSVPTFGESACLVCGVEFVSSWCRRKRFGHIELAVPVAHTWFYKSSPNVLALLLDLSADTVRMIINYEMYLVFNSEEPKLSAGAFVSDRTFYKLSEAKARCEFVSGASALLMLLNKIDIWRIKQNLCFKLARTKSKSTAFALQRRLELVNLFIESATDPRLVILNVLPVLPPGLRPALLLKDNRYASSDLNELYRQILVKNKAVSASVSEPEARAKNMRELQQSVDALFDNSKAVPRALGYNNCALKSLADLLKGKNGRFRQNLLGKRVDYSGRSVIAPGPELNLNECGLPRAMAMELFKPFLNAKAIMAWNLNSAAEAEALFSVAPESARAFLEEIVQWHPVLLNRAPTLHKLSFQAFRVRIINSKVIRLHPLVCAGFNADFDGDQMAVHVPLTLEARAEALALMMSTKNVLHPAHGSPSVLPTQDMILGLYYMSLVSSDTSDMCFSSYADVSAALLAGLVKLTAKVGFSAEVNGGCVLRESTPGRILFNELMPVGCEWFYDTSCPPLTKAYVYELIDIVWHTCGVRRMTQFCVDVMKLGFKHACLSGVSIGKSDFPDFGYKRDVLANVSRTVGDLSKHYRVSDRWELWCNAVELIAHGVEVELAQRGDSQTSIQIIANSGARGTRSQIRQLVGLKGFVYGFNGKLCLMPVLSSYTQGLSAIEFFYTAYGSRRGLTDTALKTASSGYLTRKLVEVARDCTVSKLDCKTVKGVRFDLKHSAGYIKHNLISRTLAKPIVSGNETVLSANTIISSHNVAKLLKHGGKSVYLRSPLTCECVSGVCSFCYGADLSTSRLVPLGQAVGIIAAQSIGEPGTQLTLRAFHDTSVAKKRERVTRAHVLSPCDGVLRLRNLVCVLSAAGDAVVMGRACTLEIERGGVTRFKHKLCRGDRLLTRDGAIVGVGSLLCLGRGVYSTRMVLIGGFLKLDGFVEGISSSSGIDAYMGLLLRVARANDLVNAEIKVNTRLSTFVYRPISGEQLIAVSATYINVGDMLTWALTRVRSGAQTCQQLSFAKLSNLFENRVRAHSRTLVSPFGGRIRIGQVRNNSRVYVLEPLNRRQQAFAFVVKGKPLNVSNGEFVQKGKTLIPGELDLCSFVSRNGLNALARQFVARVQDIYDSQGVSISSKHIEIMLAQMTRYAEVTAHGDSNFSLGQRALCASVVKVNNELIANGLKLVKARRLLLGVSRICASQQSLLSAMAYQGSTNLLIRASIARTLFKLPSIKERVMLGALSPVGTGVYRNMVLSCR
ncbi:DNA-directed RNA polymerase subunit beta' [Candidatus Hodgkinia cicadicola]|nr:DNA-directed RNA polymerase subunit beta' [Candidatus Hodgkinia cicadicola]